MLVSEGKKITPAQKFARDFWVSIQNSVNLPLYFYAHMQEWIDHSQTFNTSDKFDIELDKFVQDKLNLSTTSEAIFSEFENTKSEDLRFWCGTYFMFNDEGGYDILRIDREEENAYVRFMQKDATVLSFENAQLTLTVEDVTATLTFYLPGSDHYKDKEFASLFDGKQVFSPQCRGMVKTMEKSWQVYGKKGAYSQLGARNDTTGDSLNFWNGTYSLIEITEDGERLWDKELHLWSQEQDSEPVFIQLGDARIDIENMSFYTNLLELNMNSKTGISGQFLFERGYTGEKKFNGKLIIDGKEKLITGYLTAHTTAVPIVLSIKAASTPLEIITDRLPDTPTGTLVKFLLKAEGGNPTDYVWDIVTADSDIQSLSIDSSGLVTLSLKGVDADDYSFTVKLTSAPDAATKQLTLRVTAVAGTPPTNGWQVTSAMVSMVGVLLGATVAFILYRKKNMHDHKVSGDKARWEAGKQTFDAVRDDIKNSFQKDYPEEFKKANDTLDKITRTMEQQGYGYKQYKQAHAAVDNKIKAAFTNVINRNNKLIADKKDMVEKKKKEFKDATDMRKGELQQEIADLINDIKELSRVEDRKNEYEEKSKDRSDFIEAI